MSDSSSMQEKTEEATPKKRENARQEGQIPRSPEVTTAIMLLAAGGLLAMGASKLGTALAEVFQRLALVGTAALETPRGVQDLLFDLGRHVAGAVTPILLGLAGTALFVAAVQARGVITTKPLMPKLQRVSPASNIKRLVGPRAIADLLKSLLKLAVIGAVLYPVLTSAFAESGRLALQAPGALVSEIQSRAVRLLIVAGLAYLVVAMADYAFQVWQQERQMRMSKEEVKREHKEQEGDGMLKARRRSIARQRARERMLHDVPTADVVVTNPTHIAVALRYRPDTVAAPVIVAMGERKVAERIKALARQHGVTVVENRPLARALRATGRVGHPIPHDLYVAVAEVLAFVMKQRARGGFSEVIR
jgi:flagellar biosynthesis protein FlhB